MTGSGLLRAVALAGAIQLAAFAFLYAGQIESIDRARVKEAELKQLFVTKKNLAINLDIYRTQLAELDLMFGEALRELPNGWHDPEFSAVRRVAAAHGLRVDVLQPENAERLREFYAELEARIEVNGRFHQVAAFVAELNGLPGSTMLGPFKISSSPNMGNVTLAGTVRTFRYVDNEEHAERGRAAAQKGTK